MIDQLRVETSSSIERRITTCSIASLFRPAVVISARICACSFVSSGSPWMECNMTGSGVIVESSKAADVGGSGDFAVKLQLIERLGRNCFGKDGVKAIGQWPEHHVGEENRERKHERQVKRTERRKCADRGGTPDRGSRIESTHARAILEDDPCTEKPYARDDIGDDPSPCGRIIVEQQTAHDERRSPCGNERIGACASHALPPLPLQTNCRAHCNCEQQANGELKCTDSDHVLLRSGGMKDEGGRFSLPHPTKTGILLRSDRCADRLLW